MPAPPSPPCATSALTTPPARPPSPAPTGPPGCSACATARWSTSAPQAELWLDGGHNPAGGEAIAATLARMPERPTHLICGMLNTKDVHGLHAPARGRRSPRLTPSPSPARKNTLPAEATRDAARAAGIDATTAPSVAEALAAIAATDPQARVLICGSLYLAGSVLRENG